MAIRFVRRIFPRLSAEISNILLGGAGPLLLLPELSYNSERILLTEDSLIKILQPFYIAYTAIGDRHLMRDLIFQPAHTL